jgi:putative ABC transport system permease protein
MRELESDLAMQIADNERRGMPPEVARRQAIIASGGLLRAREAVRDQQGLPWMDALSQDVTYALRSLRRSPGLTAGIVTTLALGLGVNAAMFGFLDVVFLRHPAGVANPGEVRRVWNETTFRSGTQYWSGYSYPEYASVRESLGDRATTILYEVPRAVRYGVPGRETQVRASVVQSSFFDFLGVRPALGRFFTAEEDRLGAGAPVAVASHAFWRTTLNGDASAVGRDLLVAGRRYTLIGVAAEGFSGVELDAADLWLPMSSQPSGRTPWWQNHGVNGFQMLLRPQNEAVGDAALAERVALGLEAPSARWGPWDTARAVVAFGSIVRAQGPGKKQQEIAIATRLAGVTVIVLVIACANVVNLLLARAVRRRREIAVRLAVGMSRARLTRLLLTESVLLALMAAAAAAIAAYWGGAMLRTIFLPDVRWATDASLLDWRVAGGALAAAVGAGLVAGALPAVQALRTEVVGALKAGGSDDLRHSRLRPALVVAQTALSVVLLMGAGLFVSSLDNVRALRTGFDARQIIFGGVEHDAPDSVRTARMPQVSRELAERLRGTPGVEAVALTRFAPTRGISWLAYHPDVDTTQHKKGDAFYNLVSREFFAATGMRILRGEGFPPTGPMPPVVVVNEQFARIQWPGMDVLGRCMRFESNPECYRIIGVVETAFFNKLLEKPEPQYYLPAERAPVAAHNATVLVVRAGLAAREAVSAEMRRLLQDAYPSGYPSINTMETYLEPQYRPWRLGATLFTAFGVLALIVAAIGIYSTVSYSVAQRTREFGVRSALGAATADLLRHVLSGSLRVVAIGVVLGIILALAGGRLVVSLLYGIEPGDPGVIVAVSVMLVAIATVAALGPAWRAARVNPTIALRAD